MNLSQINKYIQQVQSAIEKGKDVATQVNTVVARAKDAVEPAKAAAQQIEQAINLVKQEATPENLAQLSAAVVLMKGVAQAIGSKTTMETLSHFNKAIVALIMAALIIIETLFGFNLGVQEGTVVTILSILTPVMVWLIPNYPK